MFTYHTGNKSIFINSTLYDLYDQIVYLIYFAASNNSLGQPNRFSTVRRENKDASDKGYPSVPNVLQALRLTSTNFSLSSVTCEQLAPLVSDGDFKTRNCLGFKQS